MATEKNVSKVVFGDKTLIDLTADTVTPDKVLSSYTFHDKAGDIKTGTCDYDSDTSDATVAVAEMLSGKTAYARGTKLTGTMPNKGAVTGTISPNMNYEASGRHIRDRMGLKDADKFDELRSEILADAKAAEEKLTPLIGSG